MGGALRLAAVFSRAAVGFSGCLVFLQGCTTTPSIEIETRSVPIVEIVKRVKCEIWLATNERLEDPDYAFLKGWIATVDLTLIVNEQSGISPGVSLIEPLKTVALAGKGTFSQTFSAGLGGGVTGQANLTDTVSFSLALFELAHGNQETGERGLSEPFVTSRYYNECHPLQENDLIGNLRFKEWLDQSLSPVSVREPNFHYLTKGYHPNVGKGGGVKPTVAGALFTAQKKLDLQEKEIERKQANPSSSQQTDELNKKSKSIEGIKEITPNQLKNNPEILNNLITEHQQDTDRKILKILQDLQKNVTAALKPTPPKPPTPPKRPKLNDPLDTISHQIQFIVTWNANATPSWTLVNIKGPGPTTGTFLSGQRQSTHQLLVTMGPSKEDLQNTRSAQQFNAALQRLTVAPVLQ